MKEKQHNSYKNTKELLGNTLDYYKESMSFKVVDNLLNKTIDKYEDEIAAVDDYDDIDEKYSKRNYNKYDDEEIVYGFEKKPKRIENTKKITRNDYSDEDYNENLNYNRQNIKTEQTIGDRIRQQRQIRNQDYNLYNTRMSNMQDNRYLDRNIIDNRSRLYETRNYDFNYENNNRSSSGIKVLTISSFVIFLLVLSFLVYKINILSRDIENPTSTIVTFKGKEYDLETLIYENEKFSTKMDKLEKEVSILQNELQSVFASKVVSNPNINTTNKQNINYDKNSKQDNNKIEKNTINKEVKDTINKDIKDIKRPKNEDDIYTNLEEEVFNDDTIAYDDLLFEDENYVVKAGDTLSHISQKFYGSKSQVEKIKSMNNLKSDNLKEGQILKIPSK